jgi:hypothetical protein
MKEIVLHPSTFELPAGWTSASFRDAVQSAAAAWNEARAACGVTVVVGDPIASGRAIEDGTNVVVFRGETWCHDRRCGPESTFALGAAGMTTAGRERRPRVKPLGLSSAPRRVRRRPTSRRCAACKKIPRTPPPGAVAAARSPAPSAARGGCSSRAPSQPRGRGVAAAVVGPRWWPLTDTGSFDFAEG